MRGDAYVSCRDRSWAIRGVSSVDGGIIVLSTTAPLRKLLDNLKSGSTSNRRPRARLSLDTQLIALKKATRTKICRGTTRKTERPTAG